jgi:NitT/TauT family transport system substrate-binding protein
MAGTGRLARFAAGTVALAGLVGSSVAAGATASSAAQRAQALRTVQVGVLPIADVAPLYLGMEKGFFAQEGLKVVPHALQGGAAAASAVVGGSLQFGFGATANRILAKSHNLPIEFVANGDEAAASPAKAWSGILVAKGSSITSVKQLAGKTVAANATEGENQLALDTLLARNHVNPSSVKVVVLGFPEMPAALASHQVDAVTEVEPFVSAIEAQGGKMISPLFEGMQKSMIVAGYFANTKLISSDPSLVKSFVTAINRSEDYAQAHPAEAAAVIPTYTKIPASVAEKMNLPAWGSVVHTDSILLQEKLMRQFGWMTTTVPISQLVWSGADR